jgi:serine/threonine protein kinase
MSPQQTIARCRMSSKLGEVGRATDNKLGRELVIRVLPEVSDAGRMERFEREAKVLASLNHLHIAQIHGVHRGAGRGERPLSGVYSRF